MLAGRFVELGAAALLLIGVTTATALAPDERGRERIRGDDDPSIVPILVFAPEKALAEKAQDPETTGAIRERPARVGRTCDRYAFHPERPAEKQVQEAC